MTNLIIIIGASGPEKFLIIDSIAKTLPNTENILKLTNRPQRDYEKTKKLSDLKFGHTKEDISKCSYYYSYGTNEKDYFFWN